jgi:hypothetical protein
VAQLGDSLLSSIYRRHKELVPDGLKGELLYYGSLGHRVMERISSRAGVAPAEVQRLSRRTLSTGYYCSFRSS